MTELDRTKAKSQRFEDYLIFSDFLYENDLVLSFAVVKIIGEQIEPVAGTLYERYEMYSDEGTLNPAEADIFLSGAIKWDGCSDWKFDGQDNCLLHFCSMESATSIGRLMEHMYRIATERIPKFDRSLAGMA